jgi:hypothetical protein
MHFRPTLEFPSKLRNTVSDARVAAIGTSPVTQSSANTLQRVMRSQWYTAPEIVELHTSAVCVAPGSKTWSPTCCHQLGIAPDVRLLPEQ